MPLKSYLVLPVPPTQWALGQAFANPDIVRVIVLEEDLEVGLG